MDDSIRQFFRDPLFTIKDTTDEIGEKNLGIAQEHLKSSVSPEDCVQWLLAECRRLTFFIVDGHISLDDAYDVLEQTALKIGLDSTEVLRCLNVGFRQGTQEELNRRNIPKGKINLTGKGHSALAKKLVAKFNYYKSGLPKLPLECLPEPVRDIIRDVAGAYNTDYWTPFAAVLKTVCAYMGASYFLRFGNYTTPAHQWMMLVCPSGTRKSIVTREIFRPVEERQKIRDDEYLQAREQFDRDLEEWEDNRREHKKKKEAFEEKRPLMPVNRQYFVNNITIEKLARILADNPAGVIWDNDEIATLIKGFDKYSSKGGGNEKEMALSMYVGAYLRVQRVKEERMIQVDNAWLSIYGTVQPQILPDLIGKNDIESGFLQRFMFFCPQVLYPKPTTFDDRVDENTELKEKIEDVFHAMLDWDRKEKRDDGTVTENRIITLSPEAHELLDSYQLDILWKSYLGDVSSDNTTYRFVSRAGRWCEQCTRLVLDLHCLECSVRGTDFPDPVVSAETVKHAIEIFKCIKVHNEHAWSLIEEKLYQTPSKSKYSQIPVTSILPAVKKYLELKDGRYYFVYSKNDNFKKVTEEVSAKLNRDLPKRYVGRALTQFNFQAEHSNIGAVYSIDQNQFDELWRAYENSLKQQNDDDDEEENV